MVRFEPRQDQMHFGPVRLTTCRESSGLVPLVVTDPDSCLPSGSNLNQSRETRNHCQHSLRQLTSEPTPPLPWIPPALPGDNQTAQCSLMDHVPTGYVYLHAPLPNAEFFNLDACAKDSMLNKDFIPDFADWWRNIHWLVHYLLCGDAATIHYADESSLLSEHACGDEQWSKWTGFLSILFPTITGHFKVYFIGYIFKYYHGNMYWKRRKYMKTIEWFPKCSKWYNMLNHMIAYCGYGHGKMRVNGAWTMSGLVFEAI